MDHLPDPTKVRAEACAHHGTFQARHLFGRVWSQCPTCVQQQQQAEADEQLAAQRRQAEARQRKLLGRAAVPERFIGRGFDDFRADTEPMRAAATILRDYAENFDAHARKGHGLVLAGKPGTGKSHLAGAVLQAHLEKDVLYATCMDLIRLVRETWRRDSARSEREVLAHLASLDLLVIDEVGVQYGTEGEQHIMFDVLDARYRAMRPTILLTNQNTAGLKACLGERSHDRLREMCRMVPFEWESYRPVARKEQTP